MAVLKNAGTALVARQAFQTSRVVADERGVDWGVDLSPDECIAAGVLSSAEVRNILKRMSRLIAGNFFNRSTTSSAYDGSFVRTWRVEAKTSGSNSSCVDNSAEDSVELGVDVIEESTSGRNGI